MNNKNDFFNRTKIRENTDIVSCLSNLSSDEVFTPPYIANIVLDSLPDDIFKSKDTKFLDPFCKSGIFLREIAKRLLDHQLPGYKQKINLIKQKKNENTSLSDNEKSFLEKINKTVDHIFKKQLFGISITELTSLLSRRTVYCSKYPNCKYSIVQFDNPEGNIRFRKTKHNWVNKRCSYCGANQDEYDRDENLENHAYEFIHTENPEEIFDNMKFDVIIGNPPYQLKDGGNGSSSVPIYQHFVSQAKKMNPRYLSMIIPARWYSGGKGLDEFRKEMFEDKQIKELHDFTDAKDCFYGVEIKGGVCYFLWEKGHNADCKIISHKKNTIVSTTIRPLLEDGNDVFIRYNEGIDIIKKIKELNESKFNKIVSTRMPFGIESNFNKYKTKKSEKYPIKIYMNKNVGYVSEDDVLKNKNWINKWKVYISKAIGKGSLEEDVMKPFLGEPNSICSETYIVIGPFETKQEAENVISYIQTKFFHCVFGLRKISHNTTQETYSFIPIQDFKKPWTDDELYKKYKFTEDTINFIESIIKNINK